MSQKCVHQGCGKSFDAADGCLYHPGPPVFHEGQKGWTCCKPRVLTFEEFLAIPPCTTGRHSTTDLPPQIEKKKDPAAGDAGLPAPAPRAPVAAPRAAAAAAATPTATAKAEPPDPETDDDDPTLPVPAGKACRRRACGAVFAGGQRDDDENCVFHPGAPIFHEGSKGYLCCKRRVLEFDQFLKIEGCETRKRHLFVGSGGKRKPGAGGSAAAGGGGGGGGGEPDRADEADNGGFEMLDTVRHDFYQTTAAVIASFFLKKIDPATARVSFAAQTLSLDLRTAAPAPAQRYAAEVPLFAPIDPAASTFKILGTKLEVTLAKADGASWPVLRSDEERRGVEILQVGRAGRA